MTAFLLGFALGALSVISGLLALQHNGYLTIIRRPPAR